MYAVSVFTIRSHSVSISEQQHTRSLPEIGFAAPSLVVKERCSSLRAFPHRLITVRTKVEKVEGNHYYVEILNRVLKQQTNRNAFTCNLIEISKLD